MILGIGYLLAGITVAGWFWFLMPELVGFAEHTHYPIKLLGVAASLGVLSGSAVLWPARWLAGRIDPAARAESRAKT